ncbi:hypothetical protein CPB86DRAFT_779087 [Serendipita vermifera]|nr:hypothetical protein CPB86DRAFT_779087 [Serendipita vermifera]
MEDLPVGRYGTIHYMSLTGSEVPLASYPIDEEVIRIGRSDHNTCHIRLFDRSCSDIHCKVVFEDGKAFLVVLGENGVVIDGSTFTPSPEDASPTTVPLTNGSEWLISKRRFIFQYPPKEQRAKLLDTPQRKSRKSLRMSMVNSAQVWTPSVPPKSEEESLRLLKAPIVPFPDHELNRSGQKASDMKIRLVEGDPIHVAHNQEEIVVMENVDAPPEPVVPPSPQVAQRGAPQTPGKRGRASLHRQVLLLNSHRKHSTQLNELEEREVEASIIGEEEEDNFDDELEEDVEHNPFMRTGPSAPSRRESGALDQSSSLASNTSLTAKSFRASLGSIGSILPFGRPGGAVVHSPQPQDKSNNSHEEANSEEVHEEPRGAVPQTPEAKRPLGSFMTPQVGRHDSKLKARQSVGGSVNRYTDLDQDLEQARRRLAELGPVSRPLLVDPNEEQSKAHTAPRPSKRPRASIADAPDLSSPLPASKGKFSIVHPSMATIPEPYSSPIKEHEASDEMPSKDGDGDGDEDDSALRLQRLMRTVEDVNRRESIRESRRSMAGPTDVYLPITAFKAPTIPASSESTTKSPPLPSQNAMPMHDVIMDDMQEEEDTSAKESETAQPKRAGRKPTKASTAKSSTAGKRTTTKKRAYEEMMDVDEADASSAPQTSVDHSMQTQEDVKMEDESDSLPVTQGRATRAPAVAKKKGRTAAASKAKSAAQGSQENADADVKQEADEVQKPSDNVDSPMEDAPTDSTAPRGRRGASTAASRTTSKKEPTGTKTSRTTKTKPEAKATSTSTTRGKRGGKASAKTSEQEDPLQGEGDGDAENEDEGDEDELDLISSDAPGIRAPSKGVKRTTRAKTAEKEEPAPATKAKATKKATTTTAAATKRGKATTPAPVVPKVEAEEPVSMDSEPVPAKTRTGRTTRKATTPAVVGGEEDTDEVSVDAKPRRATRAKK